MNVVIGSDIRPGLFHRLIKAARHVDVKLSKDVGSHRIMTALRQSVAIGFYETREHMRFAVEVRQGHQMKPVFAGPAKRILGAGAAHPDRRMRPLHRFGVHRDVLIIEKLAGEIDRLVRPRLPHDLNAFVHTARGFFLVDAEFSVFMPFAALANAEFQSPVGNDVDHCIRFGDVDRVVQRQNVDRNAETNPFRRARDRRHESRRMRQRAAVHGEVMLGDPDMLVAEPVHLFHLREHFLVKFRQRPVPIRYVRRQVMGAKFNRLMTHQIHGLQNFVDLDIGW